MDLHKNDNAFNWSELCPTKFEPFDKDSNKLAECFQIYFQIPTFLWFSIFSAYFCGLSGDEVLRDSRQLRSISVRIFVIVVLMVEPLMQLVYMLQYGYKVYPAFVYLVCIEFVGFTVHLCYQIVLRKRGSLRHSGPLILNVMWASIFALKIISLQTNYDLPLWEWPLINVLLHCIYAGTLITKGNSQLVPRSRVTERTRLISDGYQSFPEYDQSLGPAQDNHNLLSKMLFLWVTPLIQKGVANLLQKNEDLFDLPDCLNINLLADKLQKYLNSQKSLFWSLHRSFGLEFYAIGIFRLISDLSGFAGPLLLGGLLATTENIDNVDFRSNSFKYAGGLLLATLISAFAGVHFNWRISIVSMKMRTSLISAIYRKGLEAKELQDAKPEILNLMSTDTDRIVNSCISFHSLWSIPFQLFTSLYLLYTQVGTAFISAVIFAIALIPINRMIANSIGKVSEKLMSAKDERVSVSSECLNGAKQIKLQAWEDFWINRIIDLRQKEVKFLAKRKYLDAMCVYFWATTPVIMCLLTFGSQALSGTVLNAAKTYTAVSLLNMLIGPLNAFPWVLNGLTEAWVSLKRVQNLIDLDNIDYKEYYNSRKEFSQNSEHKVLISVENADFEFDLTRERDPSNENLNQETIQDFKLENVNLQVMKGELAVIEGKVGSGKTALVNAILGNLKKTQGSLFVQDQEEGFGFVAQSSWLQRGTIRENILWGGLYEESKYEKIIEACALKEDLEILGGDLKGVGEGGRTLSGGQRARISLARAIYQEKEIYVLDDFLSALDAHVATHIIKKVIFGLLSKKTRIIVSEHQVLLNAATQIIHVEKGSVSFIHQMNDNRSSSSDDWTSLSPKNSPKTVVESAEEPEDDSKSLDSILEQESREYGKLSGNVLGFYFMRAMTGPVAFLVLASVFFMQVSRNMSDAWLAHWVTETTVPRNVTPADFANPNGSFFQDNDGNNTSSYYLKVYSTLSIANSFVTLIRSFLFAWAGINAAKKIHILLLKNVIYTKLSFFDVTPLGRLLNRFSSDTYTVDDSLPFIFNIFLAQLFGLLGALVVSIYAMPWLIILVIPLIPIYLNLQSKYRNASRDIKRLSSVAMSPLYAQFTETLQGLATIRGMRASTRFRQDFSIKVEESIRAQVTSSAAQQWLGLRLQILGALIVGGAGFLTAVTSAHTKTPGLVGLAISYALSISSLLGGVLNALAETEQELIAVERISQYCDLEPEVNSEGSSEPPFAWPFQGVICFRNVFLSYRENLGHALNGVDFETSSFERIGIVGRTGAGKSSIIAALLRVAPISDGEIFIDYVDISTLPLSILRSRVSIVSQDPFLFSGTVRQNLDPFEVHLDSEIWQAITHCFAAVMVQQLGGLHGKIEKGGSNLSAGQKQLLCLTRALLKSSKIVLIDEGTSNLDGDTEHLIQIVLRNAFKTATVLVIAHRLNGLQSMDRIIVIDEGRIVEQGIPRELANNNGTYLYDMLEEQNNKTFKNC